MYNIHFIFANTSRVNCPSPLISYKRNIHRNFSSSVPRHRIDNVKI
jgi:hypothetical protein